jgi:hypothetical protein
MKDGDLLGALEAMLFHSDHSGRRKYSDQVVEDFKVAWLLDALRARPKDPLPPGAPELLARFAVRAAIPSHLPPREAIARARAYFATNPLPPELVRGIHALVRRTSAPADRYGW